jgi:hypothetical protein
MSKYIAIDAIEEVLSRASRMPTAVMWNRLEGRPRRQDFSRALRAEVRDSLWLLTRQWQMGEFLGEDAGSPVTATVAWRSDRIAALELPNGETRPLDETTGLEPEIEARPVALARGGIPHRVDLRLALGRRFTKLLRRAGHGARVPDFVQAYPFPDPAPGDEAAFPITAHASTWQLFAAVAGRAVDGGALLLHLRQAGARASEGLALAGDEAAEIDAIGDTFLAWAEGLYMQPAPGADAFDARHLEYRARISAPRPDRPAQLSAREYRGDKLDWYSFDAVAATGGDDLEPSDPAPVEVEHFVPTAIQFEGMPHTRYWAFEEGATNFGHIEPDTTDLSKLLLIEFGLVYANDWFLLPIEVPVNSLTQIEGLAVTNVFGERYWIDRAADGGRETERWRMFELTDAGARDPRLLVPATTAPRLESEPLESVALVRDEVANMVWGIESVVQLADGATRRGREVASELHARHQAETPSVAAPTPTDAAVSYSLMTSVAEHWIPFIPVRVPGDNHEIQLQRAAMPRLLEGAQHAAPAKVAPRSQLLREGLDESPARPYFIAEEEIERTGTTIDLCWRRGRLRDGRVVVWLGQRRRTGRGEASSTLAFDAVVPARRPRP